MRNRSKDKDDRRHKTRDEDTLGEARQWDRSLSRDRNKQSRERSPKKNNKMLKTDTQTHHRHKHVKKSKKKSKKKHKKKHYVLEGTGSSGESEMEEAAEQKMEDANTGSPKDESEGTEPLHKALVDLGKRADTEPCSPEATSGNSNTGPAEKSETNTS